MLVFSATGDPVLAFLSPSPTEMMVVAVVALLLFGGKLPEVARSWGRSFAEFRRSFSGIQGEINDVFYSEPERLEYRDDAVEHSQSLDPDSDDSTEDVDTDAIAEASDEPSTKSAPPAE